MKGKTSKQRSGRKKHPLCCFFISSKAGSIMMLPSNKAVKQQPGTTRKHDFRCKISTHTQIQIQITWLENGGTLGMVPLIIKPIYTSYCGYLLGILHGWKEIGSNGIHFCEVFQKR